MFGKDKNKCPNCQNKIKDSFEFCPHCGIDLADPERDMKDFGMLGKNEFVGGAPLTGGFGGLGITDKMINSLLNSLVKNLDKQMRDLDPEVQSLPNGIRINFGAPARDQKKQASSPKKQIVTQEQLKRMSGLPRVEAKTDVRRLSDKVVYELKAQGVESPEDVFVSKLENGYEVKAIGKKKVYVNSLPVDLPLKKFRVGKQGLTVEFGLE